MQLTMVRKGFGLEGGCEALDRTFSAGELLALALAGNIALWGGGL
jgi:hypothetical protein